MKADLTKTNKSFFSGFLKGTLVALLISLVSILIFALVIKFFNVDKNIIQPVNQVIKFLSILIGIRAMYKSAGSKKLILGILLGAMYTFLCILIFKLLSQSVAFDKTVITDICFGAVAGLISAVINKLLLNDNN